jgi:hypothetical protein
VTFENRNHFFTDWREFNSEFVDDITEKLSSKKYKKTLKILNLKEDGTYFLPGIWPQHRQIKYIPSENIDNSVLTKLKSGDYAGIYSDMPGLDVSHVGIIIKKGDSVFLRHASSELKYRKVIDQDFRDYVTCKPGLIVLRPKNTV